jgi:HK97 family phage portal protein
LERGRKPAKSHPLYYLLSQEPNLESTAINFFQTMMIHAVAWQNAYAEIERDAYGRVRGLWPRLPWRTKAMRVRGRVVYETTDTNGGVPRIIQPEDMIHIVGFSLDGMSGTPLVNFCRQSLGLSMVAARYGARFYANGARPSFFLQPESPLSPEDMTLLKEDVTLMTSGQNQWSAAALPNGIKVTPVAIDNANNEYVATRKFEREEVAAIMRVPGYMVAATDKALKSTIEAQNQEFLTYSLRPWLERFEQELNRKLLGTAKYVIKFWTDALLAVDKSTRTECYKKGRDGGWLSINDIREAEGLEVIEGGDDYIQPLNVQPVAVAKTDVETEDDEADPTQSRSIFLPLMKDAMGRLQHRSNKDFKQTLSPICNAIAATLRTGEAGAEEQKAIEKFITAAETRSAKWSDDPSEDELNKLYRALVFATERDKADARAKEVLAHV